MNSEPNVIAPKRGDRVAMAQQEGVYEVADINSLMQTANLKRRTGKGTSREMCRGRRSSLSPGSNEQKRRPERQRRPGDRTFLRAVFEE